MMDLDIKELVDFLRNAGLEAELCDTPVPVSICPVPCGTPSEPGNDDRSEYLMLPKALVGLYPEMVIHASGNSMIEAGLEPGDKLLVRFFASPQEGETVLARIDKECTVKSYYIDAVGRHWLVPRNNEYEPILLNERMDVQILGVVINTLREAPRTSSHILSKAVEKYMATHPCNEPEANASAAVAPADITPIDSPYDTSFFIYRDGRSYNDCMEKFYQMLNTSTVQAKVLRKLFGAEGREWFNLYERDLSDIVRLLNQFPNRCNGFTLDMVKKIIAEYRDIILQDQLSRLSKSPK